MFPCLRVSLTALAGLMLVLVTSCAGGSVGRSLEKSLQADPQLQNQAPSGQAQTPVVSPPSAASTDKDMVMGPVPPADWGHPSSSSTPAPSASPSWLASVPEDLKPYLRDWLALGLEGTSNAAFQPNQSITRGQYAEWLLLANNRFFGDQAAKRLRSAGTDSKPAFQDVSPTHPDYGAIQGLAEAGIIPSALSGNSTAVNFRPDAPLTRETLVLWKVPLDTRSPLPTATVEAVKTGWGFQDAGQIDPFALRAVLADRQAGDFANILRAFGYTTLFQPKKAVTQAEAAAALWRFGSQTEGISAQELLKR
ncbi:MAG: S-layer homology domain-containing protein [Nodosilinea sp. LVE1205-7]